MKTKIQVLPQDKKELEIQQEMGISRPSFEIEYRLFNLIKEGMSELLSKEMKDFFSQKVVMGRMTGNTSRQIQYWAVATIAVAVHYAILGGLDENVAFNASDEAIRKIDRCTDTDEIFEILNSDAINLCEMVKNCKKLNNNNKIVKKCVRYIRDNLKERITLKDLAEECNLSEGYVSKLFQKETGMKAGEFITKEKLKFAKELVLSGQKVSDISFELGFCNESHFIECFKKEFGTTPGKFSL